MLLSQKRIYFFIAGLFVLLCSSAYAQDTSKIIQRNWPVHSGYLDLGEKILGKGDTLILINNEFVAGNRYNSIKGKYFIEKGHLVLLLKPDLKDNKPDSLRLQQNDENTSIDVYTEGKKVAAINETAVVGIPDTLRIQITKLSATQLDIKYEGAKCNLRNKPTMVKASFSFNSLLRGMLGMITLILILYLFSNNRRKIPWNLVVTGLFFQVIFALLVLKVPFIQSAFEAVSQVFVNILQYTKEGSEFLFGKKLLDSDSFEYIFVFQILPTIIFFSALTSVMYYFGILQWIVYGLAWMMGKTMKISGAENLSTAANIFLGQTEAPLLIKPYLSGMTRSEILCVMIGGMANTAGGVMAAYVGFLGGNDPDMQLFFAKHLLASTVMSAPATIIVAKMLIPQTEEIKTDIKIPKEKMGANVLEAIANGTQDGLKLAVNVAAMLIVFIALVAMVNAVFINLIGDTTGLNGWVANVTSGQYKEFSLQFIFGYSLAPFTWLLGVDSADITLVGQLLGEKTVLNEFIAYKSLGEMKEMAMFSSERSMIMSTYILCGFANFASIGIQIGGIGTLAPDKRSMLSELGMKALLGGTIATLFTAVVVGMLL